MIGGVLVGMAAACAGADGEPPSTERAETSKPAKDAGTTVEASAAKADASPPKKPAAEDAGRPPNPDEPADCMARCTATIAPACGEPASFCDDVCATANEDVLARLEQNDTCDKEAWIACQDAEDGDAG